MKTVLGLFLAAALAAHGGTFFAATTSGSDVAAIDLTGFTTTGSDMAGMILTGTFSNTSFVQCTWISDGGAAGHCTASGSGVGFSVTQSGDTYFNEWHLSGITGSNLLTLSFDGLPGFTVFDRTNGFATGTAGSSLGLDASGSTSPNNVDATPDYRNPVGTLGNAPVGDIYAIVILSFDDGGLAPGATADWNMDTDNIGLRDGAPGSGVPEPSTMGLMGAALGGLAIVRRRRSAQKN